MTQWTKTLQYRCVWRVEGANTLPEGVVRQELFRFTEPTMVAYVTSEVDRACEQIDRRIAFSNLVLDVLLRGRNGDFEEEYRSALSAAISERQKKFSTGVYLEFVGETDASQLKFSPLVEAEHFYTTQRTEENDQLFAKFRKHIQSTLAGVVLALRPDISHSVSIVGEQCFYEETGRSKPIFASKLGGTANLTLCAPLDEASLKGMSALVGAVRADARAQRPLEILLRTLSSSADPLQKFFVAWAALELFVTTTFADLYRGKWESSLSTGTPSAAKEVLEKILAQARENYRSRDRFSIIAALVNPTTAASDIAEFNRLNKIRNQLFHAMEVPVSLIADVNKVEALTRTYIRFYLER
jgi:hypothetical protein